MKHSFFLLTIFLAAGTASFGCAAEDLTVVSNVTTSGKPGGIDTHYISVDHIRHSQSQGTDVIIDLKTGTMTNVNEKKKNYFVMTKQDMEAVQAKMAERGGSDPPWRPRPKSRKRV
jgi:hypothetical protein